LERLIMIQYESDERAVNRIVTDETADVSHGVARTIAAWFNEPGMVAAFVSTGAMPADETFPADALMGAIRAGVDAATLRSNADALDALEAYLSERESWGDVDPVVGWSQMWVPKHVDYPHESGALRECWCYDDEGDEDEADGYEESVTPVNLHKHTCRAQCGRTANVLTSDGMCGYFLCVTCACRGVTARHLERCQGTLVPIAQVICAEGCKG
jgi:hypothetical protein